MNTKKRRLRKRKRLTRQGNRTPNLDCYAGTRITAFVPAFRLGDTFSISLAEVRISMPLSSAQRSFGSSQSTGMLVLLRRAGGVGKSGSRSDCHDLPQSGVWNVP